MTTYQEMLDALAGMDEQRRRLAIQTHWQAIFSDGFIAFVQGQIEVGRKMILSGPESAPLFAILEPAMVTALKQQMLRQFGLLVEVWDSMVAVYEMLQRRSEGQGNAQGMVAHGRHRTMPRGIGVTEATRCYRCGSPAASRGLCDGCLATERDWERDELDHERQRIDLEYQRLQDDRIYSDNQRDFNSYTDYSPDH
jgi:hypothetical protein